MWSQWEFRVRIHNAYVYNVFGDLMQHEDSRLLHLAHYVAEVRADPSWASHYLYVAVFKILM